MEIFLKGIIELYEFYKSPVDLFVWNHQFLKKIA